MKQFFFTISYLLVLNVANSQSALTIRGVILRSSDSLPIYNAHIYFERKDIGTTSNEEGRFIFHFPNKYEDENIQISSIGYKSYALSAFSYAKSQIIYLTEDQYLLDEITITAIDPIEILENAINKLSENYNQKKFTKTLYYKEYLKRDERPLRYLEIVADLTASGFSNKRKYPDTYKVGLIEKRVGFNSDTTYEEGGNGIGVLHWLFWSEQYFKKKKLKDYQIEYIGQSQFLNQKVYHILLKKASKNKIETSIYITKDNYAIVAISYSYINSNRELPSSKQKFRFLKFIQYADFQKSDDGYWYINSIDDYREAISSEGVITEIKRSIRVTSINPNDKLNIKNKITRETDLYKYQVPYNPEFWKNYNAPPETEEEKRIKAELIQQELNLEN